jgi:hypothetical protein
MLKIGRLLKSSDGILSLELLLTIFFLSLALVGFLSVATFLLGATVLSGQQARAENLATAQMEALRSFRDGTTWLTNGLGNVTSGTAYYLKKTIDNPPAWSLVPGEEAVSGFSRKVVFSDVYRDNATDNIVSSSGVYDSETKKAIVTVSWGERGRTHQVSLVTYFTNWKQ